MEPADARPSVAPLTGTPRLSCVMIFLDGERYIDEAIRSVLGQVGYDDWELLLVDDGSTDASSDTARTWAAAHPTRVRYLDHDGHANRGMSASRNLGIAAARGDVVTFLDCDDVLLPAAFAHRMRVLDLNPDAEALFGRCWRWYSWSGRPEDLSLDHPMAFSPRSPLGRTIEPPALFSHIYAIPGLWYVPATCGLVIRRSVLLEEGGFEESFRGLHEDQVLYAKLSLARRVVLDDRPLALYRQHADSACETALTVGTWSRVGPSAAEDRFLAWLQRHVAELRGEDSDESAVVRANLGRETPAAEAPLPWRAAIRRRLPAPVRRAARRARRMLRPEVVAPAEPTPTIVETWTAQFLEPWRARLGGRVLVAAPIDGRTDTSSIEWLAAPGATIVPEELDAASGVFDVVVATLAATGGRDPRACLARAARLLRPDGVALVLLPGPALEPSGSAASAIDLIDVIADAQTPFTAIGAERFGNATTRDAIRAGRRTDEVPGVEIDRHDPDAAMMFALAMRRRA